MYGFVAMPEPGAFFPASNEDDQPQQMDEKEEEEAAPVEAEDWSDQVRGTAVDPAQIETAQDGRLRYHWPAIPPSVIPLSPNVLCMLAASQEHAEQHALRASAHAVLPTVLHTPTMVMLLAGHFPADKSAGRERMWWPRYMGYMESMCRLMQFIEAATRANPRPPPEHVGRSYLQTIGALTDAHEARLQAFYGQLRARGPPWGVDDALLPLMALLKRHTVDVVHTMERYLYEAMLAPHEGVPPVSQTLSMPCDERPSTDVLIKIRRDAYHFFAQCADPARGGSELNYQLLETAPFADTDVDGWLPLPLAWNYFHYLDQTK